MHSKNNKIHWARKDTYNLNTHLSQMIADGLKKYLEVIKSPDCVGGCPADLCGQETRDKLKIPESVYRDAAADISKLHEFWTEADSLNLQKGLLTWYWMIEEMIWAYRMDEHEENIYWNAYSKTLEIKDLYKEGDLTFTTIVCDEALKKHFDWAAVCVEARYQRAMAYWAAYYRNLWW